MAYPLVAAGRTPFPPGTTVEHLSGTQELIFKAVFLINFTSTALFKKAFLELDLAGRPFGGDFEQLSPRKMKKHMYS